MTRPGIDVERLARNAVERTLARTKTRVARHGSIYCDMVKENADLIRKALRAAARIAHAQTAYAKTVEPALAHLSLGDAYFCGARDASQAIRHAARTRKGT